MLPAESFFRSLLGLLESTVEYVKKLLSDLIPKNLDSRPSQATFVLIQSLVRKLPRPLGERLGRDSDFMARLGLKTIAVAEVGDLRFDKGVYTSAITAAINGRQAVEAKLLNTDISAQFEATTSATSTVRIHVPSTDESIVIFDPIFGLLKDSTQEREMAASELSREFDLPPDEIRTTIAELASMETVRLDCEGRRSFVKAALLRSTRIWRKN